MADIQAMSAQDLEASFKEINDKNALRYVIHYVTNAPDKDMFPYVRVFDSDDGYIIKNLTTDEILIELNIMQVKLDGMHNSGFSVLSGPWKGAHLSCKDSDIIKLTDILLNAYRSEKND